MEGTSSPDTEDKTISKAIRDNPNNVSVDSSATDTSVAESSFRASRRERTIIAVDLDAIEPLEESEEETQSMMNVVTEGRDSRLNMAAIHKGVLIIQAVFGLAATMVKAVALVFPKWVCHTEMLKNGTSNACCGPWKICDTLMTFDDEVAFDSFEEIGSFGVANITLLCFFCVIALIEAAPPPKVCVEVPWAPFIKVKMITSCCISIIYVVIISIFKHMIADLKKFGFKAGDSLDILYTGFVSSMLLFVTILLELCVLPLRKDPPPIW